MTDIDPDLYCDQCSKPQWPDGSGLCSWRCCAETGSCDGKQHRKEARISKPILVGESNPYGADPDFALYPAPAGCSGHRLCHLILGMTEDTYLDAFERVNLCEGPWSMRVARKRVEEILATPARFVLCGRRVADAFRVGFSPFSLEVTRRGVFCVLPHPSGRNFLWRQDGAVALARKAVSAFAPEIAPFLGVTDRETVS